MFQKNACLGEIMRSRKPKFGDFAKKYGGKKGTPSRVALEGAEDVGAHILVLILPFLALLWIISFIVRITSKEDNENHYKDLYGRI